MYDLTNTPNLKPFRQIDNHDVVNLYAHVSGSVNRGSLVKLLSGDATAHPNELTLTTDSKAPARVTSMRPVVKWKVDNTTSGDTAFGITLYDVREVDSYGEKYIYKPRYETSEQQIVISGQAVPVVTKGIVEINGFYGVPNVGSGAVVPTTGAAGRIQVSSSVAKFGSTRIGTFLSTTGADGYALLKIEL